MPSRSFTIWADAEQSGHISAVACVRRGSSRRFLCMQQLLLHRSLAEACGELPFCFPAPITFSRLL